MNTPIICALCPAVAVARGLCHAHWMRAYRLGALSGFPNLSKAEAKWRRGEAWRVMHRRRKAAQARLRIKCRACDRWEKPYARGLSKACYMKAGRLGCSRRSLVRSGARER